MVTTKQNSTARTGAQRSASPSRNISSKPSVQPQRKNQGTAKAAPKGKRTQSQLRRLTLTAMRSFIVLCVLLAAVIIIKKRYVDVPAADAIMAAMDSGTYYSGIAVNGIDISGLSYEEARAKVLPSIEAQMQSIGITIVHDNAIWILNATDMGISSTLDAVLTEAMALGRSSTSDQNQKVQEQLKSEGKAYTVSFNTNLTTLTAAITKISASLGTLPVEPTIAADAWSDKPSFKYIEGKDGYSFNTGVLINDINTCLANGNYQAVLNPPLTVNSPEHDVAWLKGNVQLRATWTTSFGGSSAARNANRVGNIQKATTMLNGASVAVGEEWNFNAFIGPRTEKDGWPMAPGIVNGNSYEDQAGGGICQVSTTLYNALLCCGPEIKITERYHHSWPSSYTDTGLDATVTGTVSSGKSLNFINNTGATLYIFAYCDQANYTMTIYIYGEPLPEGITYSIRGVVTETIEPGATVTVENANWPTGYKKTTVTARKGYVAEAYRDKYVNGKLESSELLYTDKYRAVTGEVTVGTGDASLPTPSS